MDLLPTNKEDSCELPVPYVRRTDNDTSLVAMLTV
jgi:hypothetical protein